MAYNEVSQINDINGSTIENSLSELSFSFSNEAEENYSTLSFDMAPIETSESQFWLYDKRLDKKYAYNRIDDEDICFHSLIQSLMDKSFEIIFKEKKKCLEHYYAINKIKNILKRKKEEVDKLINLSIEIDQDHRDCSCDASVLDLKQRSICKNLIFSRNEISNYEIQKQELEKLFEELYSPVNLI